MNYGALRVSTPDGQTRVFSLDAPAAVIGRSSENSVVIDHSSIARRHARLVIDSGNAYIEDLGSESGTHIGGRRLDQGERAIMTDGSSAQLGDVTMTFTSPGAQVEQPRGAGAPISIAPTPGPVTTPLVATIDGPAAAIAPGSAGTATVRVQNRGSVVDEVAITVQDLPPNWSEVTRPVVTLLPGARDEVTILLRPPRGGDATAGDHAFSVSVRSREHGTEIRVVSNVAVGESSGFGLALQPVRSTRKFTARMTNTGNSKVALALSGRDDESRLNFSFSALNVELKPGEQRDVALAVKLRGAPKFGPETIRPFKVEAQEATGGTSAPKQSADGQLRHKPPLQAWKWPVLGIIAIAALAGAVVGYTQNCEDQGWPGCGKDAIPAAPVSNNGAADVPTIAPGGLPPGTPVPAGTSPLPGATTPVAGATTPPAGAATTPAGPTTPAVPTTPTGGGAGGSPSVVVSAVPTTPVPPTLPPITKKPTFKAADTVTKTGADYTAVISTTKGDITIDFQTERAPKTTNSFIFLAERGYFDNLPFTSSTAAMAVSGDGQLDGQGNPGYSTAYENTRVRNVRGAVSMVPLTGQFGKQFGSMFFINLRDNVQYDTGGIAGDIRYPFAQVTGDGMKVVDLLTPADRITKITVAEKVLNGSPRARPTLVGTQIP